jgi:hypothetical protein
VCLAATPGSIFVSASEIRFPPVAGIALAKVPTPRFLCFVHALLRPVFASRRRSVPLIPVLCFLLGSPPVDFPAGVDWISTGDLVDLYRRPGFHFALRPSSPCVTHSQTRGSSGEHVAQLRFTRLYHPWVLVSFGPCCRELHRRILVSVSLFSST